MNPNRIFCIGKNYAEHVVELAHLGPAPTAPLRAATVERPLATAAAGAAPAPAAQSAGSVSPPHGDCVIFMKPLSALVPEGAPIVLPRGVGSIHHEAELVILLTGGGRDIPEDEALCCVAGLALGLDLTLRDLQTQLKAKGAPWERAKAFDGSAPLGEIKPYLEQDLQALEFTCHVNGTLRQHGLTRDMLYPVARQIHILSQTWALEPGDVIFTGTPKGVGPLQPGDEITLASPTLGTVTWNCE